MEKHRRVNLMTSYGVSAVDGGVGRVRDFYFDDATWRVRHVVVNSGRWPFRRQILLDPLKIVSVDHSLRTIFLSMTKADVMKSPLADTDKPVALQEKERQHLHYGWEMYLGSEALFTALNALDFEPRNLGNAGGRPFDPHLRSTHSLKGYDIYSDGEAVARIADLLVTNGWAIRHLIVCASGHSEVILPTHLVSQIDCVLSGVHANVSAKTLWGCPPVLCGEEVGEAYLDRVDEHFGLHNAMRFAAG